MTMTRAPMTVDAAYLRGRLVAAWPVLIFIVLFGWLDWITHRDVPFLVVVGALALGGVVFGPALLAGANLTASVARIPWWLRPFLFALPAYAYLLIRGQGTTDAGPPIMITGLILMATLLFVGPTIDAKLAPFYQVRNRIVPRPVRIVLSPVIAILLSFLIVHGDLSSLPAFWGGSTQTRKKAIDTSTSLFVVAALLSTVVTLLLLREVQTRRLTLPAPSPRPGTPPGTMASPQPGGTPQPAGFGDERALVPAAGAPAWSAPEATAAPTASLAGRTELTVVERRGAWARVRAANGWTGWVDGRVLVAPPAAAAEPTRPMTVFPGAAVPGAAVGSPPASQASATGVWSQAAPPGQEDVASAPRVERARIPAAGTRAWPAPDAASAATTQLAPGLEVAVLERRGAWAHVRASNGWTGWIDGRVLDAGTTGGPP